MKPIENNNTLQLDIRTQPSDEKSKDISSKTILKKGIWAVSGLAVGYFSYKLLAENINILNAHHNICKTLSTRHSFDLIHVMKPSYLSCIKGYLAQDALFLGVNLIAARISYICLKRASV